MRNRVERAKFNSVTVIIAVGLMLTIFGRLDASGQTNSWTNAASGGWEDAGWSLGSLPGDGQTILLTNAGWKALAIGTNTARNFPQSLHIFSLTISSPTNSFNELLMNYAGLQVPLVVGESNYTGTLILQSNASVSMLSSALVVLNTPLNGPSPGEFSIGGTFMESAGSQVAASVLQVGDIGPGVYDLTNSVLSVPDSEYIGGNFSATFNQQGGTNATGNLILQGGGEYDIYDGEFSGNIDFQGGNFNQWGGNVVSDLQYQFWLGTYQLAGGTLSPGDLSIPGIPPQNLPKAAGGLLQQTGGTNIAGNIRLGNNYGTGGYNLSNGVLRATSLDIGYYQGPDTSIFGCTFTQSGGFQTNGGITVNGNYNRDFQVGPSHFVLSGGTLQTPSISLSMGAVTQSGGTNEVGEVSLGEVSSYSLSGGWLLAQNIQLNGGAFFSQTGAFTQSGGTNQAADLSLNNSSSYILSGGQTTAGTVEITGTSIFNHEGGAFRIPGVLTLADGIWKESAGGQAFAQLQLAAGSDSALVLPVGTCLLQFADSSSLAWATNGVLTIENWSGSLTGGGGQRILFGNNAAALTAQQCSQIQFENPAGLASGTYPGRILRSGEIVPDSGLPILGLLPATRGGAQLTLQGKPGQNCEIDVSPDLVHWSVWTNLNNATGTISITDTSATNCIVRYYRSVLRP